MRFMTPATEEAAFLPPISMQEAQALGMTQSLKKHAAAMNAMVVLRVVMWLAVVRQTPAMKKPVHAMMRRARVRPTRRIKKGEMKPEKSEPSPQKKSGKME